MTRPRHIWQVAEERSQLAGSSIMKFSLLRTISTDWPALFVSYGLPIYWLIALGILYYDKYLHEGRSGLFPIYMAVVVTIGLVVALVWRIRRVARLFAMGQTTAGIITLVSIFKDRGRLEYVFEHRGQPVHSWTPIHKTKAVLALRQGQEVEVLFDPDRPKRAIVKHLYERPS